MPRSSLLWRQLQPWPAFWRPRFPIGIRVDTARFRARQWPPRLQLQIPSAELAKSATLLPAILLPLLGAPSRVAPTARCRGNRHSAPDDRTPGLVRFPAATVRRTRSVRWRRDAGQPGRRPSGVRARFWERFALQLLASSSL